MEKIYSGKARDLYDIGNKLVIVTKDTISMHVPLPFEIGHKGEVLNKITKFWFSKTNHIVPNHMISDCLEDMPLEFQTEYFEGRTMMVKKLKMIPYECIVRGYITGSGWDSYKNSRMICGIKLEEGLQESEKLRTPIFTPTTKREDGSDSPVTFKQMCEDIGEELASKIRDISIKIYEYGALYALKKGIIIADTKFEFGLDEKGNLVLADEVLTPDSSRFWLLNDYQVGSKQTNFDRQELYNYNQKYKITKDNMKNIPLEIMERISDKYLDIYNILTGEEIVKSVKVKKLL